MQYNDIWKRMRLKTEVIAQPAPIPIATGIGTIGIIGELPLSVIYYKILNVKNEELYNIVLFKNWQ